MEATEEKRRTVAEVAKVKVELKENEKVSWALATVKALHEEGVKDIQAVLHLSESQAPVEDVELVDIGKSDWRQALRVPRSLSLEDRNKYIRDRAVGAASGYAEALKIALNAEAEAKAAKGAK
jgi:hypothetical protein